MTTHIHNESTTPILSLNAATPPTSTSADQSNRWFRGVRVVVNVTSVAGGGSLVVTIQGKDKATGGVYTLLASAAITTVSTTGLVVYPGITASTNLAAAMILPPTWNVKAVVSGGNVVADITAAELI